MTLLALRLPVRLPLVIAALCVLLGGLLGAIALPSVIACFEDAPQAAAADPPELPPEESITTEPLELIVNLAKERGRRFLKVRIIFQVKDEETKRRLAKEPIAIAVRDRLNGLLADKTLDDLSGKTKREALRREILGAVNKCLATGKQTSDAVLRVYFDQVTIQ